MRRLLATMVLLAALCAPAPALAWWDYGHETVAKIAWQNAAPATRRAVGGMLARTALLGTPQCPARTVAQASVWAECVKTAYPRYGHTASWHYQNVQLCEPFDLESACREGNCVSARIARDMATLRDRASPLRARIEALLFLLHFVGDLHQPLHASDNRDRGGSDRKAAYGLYAADTLSLHFLWDGPLAERAISTPPSLVRIWPSAERPAMQRGAPEDWSRESWDFARLAYAAAFDGDPCGPAPARVRMDEAAIERMLGPLRRQITRAGLRLARLLDDALG